MTALLCIMGILSYKGGRARGRGDNVCAGYSFFFRGEEEMGLIAYLLVLVTSLLNNRWSSPAVCCDSR